MVDWLKIAAHNFSSVFENSDKTENVWAYLETFIIWSKSWLLGIRL